MTITRTIVVLELAAPDQDRKRYAVHRAHGPANGPSLFIDEQVATLTATYRDKVDIRALAGLYATADAPVWEKL